LDIVDYFKQAQSSLAAYASLSGGPARYPDELQSAGLSATQASKFLEQWAVVDQYNHQSEPYPVHDEITGQLLRYDTLTNGLSVTVFEEKSTGQRYLAIRGTDDLYDIATDLVSVVILGTTRFQGQYQLLRSKVQEWISNGTLPNQFSVTEHSLGGFLATGLASEFSANVSHAYLYNAPGLGGLGAPEVAVRLRSALHITSPLPDPSKVSNIRADAGISPIAGLGFPVSPPISIVIENQFNSDVASPPGARNHSQQVLTDALAVYALYAELAPALDLTTIGGLLKGATNANAATLEAALDALRKIVPGTGTAETSIGNRENFYANVKALTDGTAFNSIASKVRIDPSSADLGAEARNDFSAVASLITLSPIVLTADPARTHVVGRLPYEQYVRVLQVSAAHVYLTYPFVLNSSLLEAMACGCLVTGSDTVPTREIVRDGETGCLVESFENCGIAHGLAEALLEHDVVQSLRQQVRLSVSRTPTLVKGVLSAWGRSSGTGVWCRLVSVVLRHDTERAQHVGFDVRHCHCWHCVGGGGGDVGGVAHVDQSG
jgi:Glycosyl transferases group 1